MKFSIPSDKLGSFEREFNSLQIIPVQLFSKTQLYCFIIKFSRSPKIRDQKVQEFCNGSNFNNSLLVVCRYDSGLISN